MRHRSNSFSLIELLVAITIIAILAGMLAPALRSAKEAGNSAKCLSNLRQLYLANSLYAESNGGQFVLGAEDLFTSNLKRWHGERPNIATPFDPSLGPLVNYLGKDGKIKECPSLKSPISSFEAGSGGYGYNHLYIGGRVDLYGFPAAQACTHSLSLNDSKAWSLSKSVMFGDTAMPQANGIAEYSFLEAPYWQTQPDPNPIGAVSPDPSTHFRHNGHANIIWCDGHASSEQMSFTTAVNVFGGDNNKAKVGWFGPRTNNAYWKTE